MVETAMEYTTHDHVEPSTAAATVTSTILPRNDDPLTVALRSETPLSLDELVHLNRTDPCSHEYPSTLGTLTTTVFSSQKESDATKPTSASTSYVVDGYNGKGKARIVKTYASSLSATNGSGSEADAEQDNALIGVGDQFGSTLRGAARARKRPRVKISKPKKVPLVIHYGDSDRTPAGDMDFVLKQSSRSTSKGKECLRNRQNKPPKDQLVLADEERVSPVGASIPASRLSRVRLNIVIGVCVFMILTFGLSVFAAHYTGKRRLACTKGIIFSATVLLCTGTILVMNVARRTLQEALLAGLLEFIVGFALVSQIRDFMEHIP